AGTGRRARSTGHRRLSRAPLARMVGLLGTASANKLNDVFTRDSTPLASPPAFADEYPHYADSWRISQAESLFAYGLSETTETFTERTLPDQPATAGGPPADVRAAAALPLRLAGD